MVNVGVEGEGGKRKKTAIQQLGDFFLSHGLPKNGLRHCSQILPSPSPFATVAYILLVKTMVKSKKAEFYMYSNAVYLSNMYVNGFKRFYH